MAGINQVVNSLIFDHLGAFRPPFLIQLAVVPLTFKTPVFVIFNFDCADIALSFHCENIQLMNPDTAVIAAPMGKPEPPGIPVIKELGISRMLTGIGNFSP